MPIAKRLNSKAYADLLVEIRPKRIETPAENRLALKVINDLIELGDRSRTREENALLDLLVTLVEQFEAVAYPRQRSEPREILRFLMESNDMKAADMSKEIGTRARVSEILSGKRAISKAQAKKLGERFRVSPGLFL